MEILDTTRYGKEISQIFLFHMIFPNRKLISFRGIRDIFAGRCLVFIVDSEIPEINRNIIHKKSFAHSICIDGTTEYLIHIPVKHEKNLLYFVVDTPNRVDKTFVRELSEKYPMFSSKIDGIFNY